jgi:hypothetical protein
MVEAIQELRKRERLKVWPKRRRASRATNGVTGIAQYGNAGVRQFFRAGAMFWRRSMYRFEK